MRRHPAQGISALLLLAGCVLLGAVQTSGPSVARAATHAVSITAGGFSPAELTIEVGDTVTWTNNTATTQTASAQIGGTDPNFFNSLFIYGGQSYSRTFTTPGVVPYRSNNTPSFTGTITIVSVGGGGSSTATPTPPPSGGGSGGESVAVSITDGGFSPTAITIAVGTTVTWTNNSPTTQTASAQIGGTDPNFFNSGFLYTGQSYSRTFTTPGTVPYRSNNAPSLTGTIIITEGGSGGPTPTMTPAAGGGSTPTPLGTNTPAPTLAPGVTSTSTPAGDGTPPGGGVGTATTPSPTKSPTPQPTPTPGSLGGAVTITPSGFSPQTITVPVGTTLTWTNPSGGARTANWTSGPVKFFSGFIYGGKAWSFTFTVPGTYTYRSIQGGFQGTVVVTGGGEGGSGGGGSSLPFSPMAPGWNLVTFGGASGAPSQALSQLADDYAAVYYWDGLKWHRYFRPGIAPSYLNTLTMLSTGQPLWILATAAIP